MRMNRNNHSIIVVLIVAGLLSLGFVSNLSIITFDPSSGHERNPLYVETTDTIMFLKSWYDTYTVDYLSAWITITGYNETGYQPMDLFSPPSSPAYGSDPMAGKEVYSKSFRLNIRLSDTMFRSAGGDNFRQGAFYGYWDVPDREQTVYRIWWYEETMFLNIYGSTPHIKTPQTFSSGEYSVIRTRFVEEFRDPTIETLRSTEELTSPVPTVSTSSEYLDTTSSLDTTLSDSALDSALDSTSTGDTTTTTGDTTTGGTSTSTGDTSTSTGDTTSTTGDTTSTTTGDTTSTTTGDTTSTITAGDTITTITTFVTGTEQTAMLPFYMIIATVFVLAVILTRRRKIGF